MTRTPAADSFFGKPLRIDPFLTLETRALPSPMAGVMGKVFCLAVSRMGLIRHWITPFLCVSRGAAPSGASLRRELDPFRNGKALIVQLLGHDPESLAETAQRLASLDAAGVNLNFACPSRQVRKSGNGGALLGNPDLIFQIASAVREKTKGKLNLSVKIRCGVDSPEEIPAIADALNAAGVRFVIAHFRTVAELYGAPRSAPLPRLAELRRRLAPDTILFGNGDIRSFPDAEKMRLEGGCDGVTIGRGLPADPFLLEKIRAGSDEPAAPEEKRAFLRELISAALDLKLYSEHWLQNGFLECAKFCLGADSGVFREILSGPAGFAARIKATDAEILEKAGKDDKVSALTPDGTEQLSAEQEKERC